MILYLGYMLPFRALQRKNYFDIVHVFVDKKSDDFDLKEIYLRSEKVSRSKLSSRGLAG